MKVTVDGLVRVSGGAEAAPRLPLAGLRDLVPGDADPGPGVVVPWVCFCCACAVVGVPVSGNRCGGVVAEAVGVVAAAIARATASWESGAGAFSVT